MRWNPILQQEPYCTCITAKDSETVGCRSNTIYCSRKDLTRTHFEDIESGQGWLDFYEETIGTSSQNDDSRSRLVPALNDALQMVSFQLQIENTAHSSDWTSNIRQSQAKYCLYSPPRCPILTIQYRRHRFSNEYAMGAHCLWGNRCTNVHEVRLNDMGKSDWCPFF